MAEFAANAAQGHIGRARYLATNEEARKTREIVIKFSTSVTGIASAFETAEIFASLARSDLEREKEARDAEEILQLKEGFGLIGSKMATGGSKAVKDLEKVQKTRNSRLVKDNLNLYLIELLQVHIQDSKNDELESAVVRKQAVILKTIEALKYNSSPQLALESMFCQLK
jgi:DNA polymerase-3 subunit delta'